MSNSISPSSGATITTINEDPAWTVERQKLSQIAAKAALEHQTACNLSTAQVARAYGYPELTGLDANSQIKCMKARWRQISASEAAVRANQGKLAVMGLPTTGKPGHTAIVVPGSPVWSRNNGGYFPLVAGGAMNEKNPSQPGTAFSVDGHGANQAVRSDEMKDVMYFAPKYE